MLENLPFSLTVAGVALLLFGLLSIIQSVRGQVRSGCLSTILMTVTLGGFVAFVVQSASSNDPITPLARNIALGLVGFLIFLGVALWFLERRKEDSAATLYSRGVFSIGTGVILLVAYLFVPQIPTSILPIPTSTPIVAAVNAQGEDSANIVPTAVGVDSTETLEVTIAPTQTRMPLPSPSPTRTRRAYVPPTSTPTPEAIAVLENCGATPTTNLNLRAEDNTDSDIVEIIPEGEYIGLTAKNLDGTWWKTEHNGVEGWLFADLLVLDQACQIEAE